MMTDKRTLPDEHGSERGYQQHNRRETVPCVPCLVAHAAMSKRRKGRGRCAAGLGWPLLAGTGPRGNSYANGQSVNNGPLALYGWRSGYQAPRPVTHWDFTEGERPR